MVWNGLKKEGAKSENFVVEPDLLTTNLGPKYGPERFIVSYRLVWPAVVYRIVIYRVSYLSEIIGIVSYPGLIVSYLIVDLQAMESPRARSESQPIRFVCTSVRTPPRD